MVSGMPTMRRPSGAWVYDAIMARVKACDDVWICTREQVARHVLATLGGRAEERQT